MDTYQDAVTGIMSDAVGVIEIWRKKRGLTRCALAKKAVISRQTAANLEGVTKDPGLAMIVRLWLVQEIPPKELTKIIRRHATRNASTQMDAGVLEFCAGTNDPAA